MENTRSLNAQIISCDIQYNAPKESFYVVKLKTVRGDVILRARYSDFAFEFLGVVGAKRWSELPDKCFRIEFRDGTLLGIYHIIDDKKCVRDFRDWTLSPYLA